MGPHSHRLLCVWYLGTVQHSSPPPLRFPPPPVTTRQASSPFTNNHLALLLGNKLLINRYTRKSKKAPRQHFKRVAGIYLYFLFYDKQAGNLHFRKLVTARYRGSASCENPEKEKRSLKKKKKKTKTGDH